MDSSGRRLPLATKHPRWRGMRALVAASTILAMATAISTGVAGASSRTTAVKHAGKTLVCEVTDTGGIDDRSFNASAYQGLLDAHAADPNITVKYLSSTSSTDYVPNINTFVGEKCNLIITVGFLMATATQNAAKAHPSQHFAIVDNQYTPALKNVRALLYETNQDAFLGGFLAAAMSKTGKVGTFGGEDIPTVTIYMDGWVAGVRYFDKVDHKHVKALGWTPKKPRTAGSFAGRGLFTNSFTNTADGATEATTLIQQGADVIFPVAGGVGLGAASVVAKQHGVTMEWVDTDGCVSDAQYCKLFITSVEKGIVPSVETAALDQAHGKFTGGNYIGTLKNNGVGLAPYHDFASVIPKALQNGLNQIKQLIIQGKISVDPNSYPAS